MWTGSSFVLYLRISFLVLVCLLALRKVRVSLTSGRLVNGTLWLGAKTCR